jgi:hypothetical protein
LLSWLAFRRLRKSVGMRGYGRVVGFGGEGPQC